MRSRLSSARIREIARLTPQFFEDVSRTGSLRARARSFRRAQKIRDFVAVGLAPTKAATSSIEWPSKTCSMKARRLSSSMYQGGGKAWARFR
jgi:hypothetical protein